MSCSEWPSPLFVMKGLAWSLLSLCYVLELQWINSRTVVLLDSVEKLHVIDRQTQEELETMEISEVQLVYNSSHFKSLATGGNVSQALVSAAFTQHHSAHCGGSVVVVVVLNYYFVRK